VADHNLDLDWPRAVYSGFKVTPHSVKPAIHTATLQGLTLLELYIKRSYFSNTPQHRYRKNE